MKKSYKVLLGMMITFGILFFLNFVSAATMLAPASSGIIGGSAVVLNASNGTNFFANLTNCTFYSVSTLSGNSTQTQIMVANASGGGSDPGQNLSINATFNSRILEDSNDYTFAAVCWARTNAGVHYQIPNQANVTSVRIDNSVPLAATALSPSSGNSSSNKSVNFVATVTGNVTTSCTIQFVGTNPNATSFPMTHSGNTCSAQLQSIPKQTYEYFIRTSDETNTSDSGVQRFTILTKGSSSAVVAQAAVTPDESGQGTLLSVATGANSVNGNIGWTILIIAAVIIIGVAVYFARR